MTSIIKCLVLQTAIIVYDDEKPVACGCHKQHDEETIEIKRMFVDTYYRGKRISKIVLSELEKMGNRTRFQ